MTQETTRKIGSPCCATCRHFNPDHPSYPCCTKVNVREGWGEIAFMPVEPDESCLQHEERARG